MAICARILGKNLLTNINLYTNLSTANTVTLTPVNNMKIHVRSRTTKLKPTGTSFVIYGSVADTSPSMIADTFALLRHNLPSTMRLRLYLYTEAYAEGVVPSGTPVYTSANFIPNTSGLYDGEQTDWFLALTASQTFKSFRVVVTVAVANTTYTLPNLYFGLALPITTSFSNAATFSQIGTPEYAESAGGGLITKRSASNTRTLTMPLTAMTAADRKTLAAAERENVGAAWLVIGYPEGADYQKLECTFIGKPTAAMQYAAVSSTTYQQATLTIKEI